MSWCRAEERRNEIDVGSVKERWCVRWRETSCPAWHNCAHRSHIKDTLYFDVLQKYCCRCALPLNLLTPLAFGNGNCFAMVNIKHPLQ